MLVSRVNAIFEVDAEFQYSEFLKGPDHFFRALGRPLPLSHGVRTARRRQPTQEAESYASDNGIFFMETSAKTATNVNELFVAIARRLPKNTPQPRAGGQGLAINTATPSN